MVQTPAEKKTKKMGKNIVKCVRCGLNVHIGTSQQPASFGKKFRRCDQCGLFSWEEEKVQQKAEGSVAVAEA